MIHVTIDDYLPSAKSYIQAEFPYNIGAYKNMCLVLGNNPLLWLWPQPSRGDGINYPVASHLSK
jgi:palmitoyltransferase